VASIAVLISGIIFIFKSKYDKISKNRIFYLLLTIFIYLAGYTLITVEWRYFWFIFILIMFTGFYLVNALLKTRAINIRIRNVLLVLLVGFFVIQPTYELIMFSSTENSFYDLSVVLKSEYGVEGNIASNDKWGEMTTISYFLNTKYYGVTKNHNNSMDLQNELDTNNIDYYFIWNKDDIISFTAYKEITGGKISNLRIYKRIK
jgi:hypothetical protein